MDLRTLGRPAVRIGNHHLGNAALVAVTLAADDLHITSEDHVGQILFGFLAEGLRLLRRINAGHADLVLGLGCIEHRNRVAIGNGNHHAPQNFIGTDR